MSIPYIIPGIIYLLTVLLGGAFFLLNWYHLRRFGFFDFTASVNTIMVASVILIILFFTVVFLSPVDWLGSGEVFPETNLSSFEINL